MNKKNISELIYNFISVTDYKWETGKIIVDYYLKDNASIEEIHKLGQQSVNFSLLQDGNIITGEDLEIGNSVTLIISPPRTKTCFFAHNLDDILTRKTPINNIPEAFIIQDQEFISWRENVTISESIKAYYSLVVLINRFIEIAVFSNPLDEKALVVFENKAIEVFLKTDEKTISRNATDIIECADIIIEILANSDHQNDKVRILKANLHSCLHTLPMEKRFTHFLNVITEFTKGFSNDYDLYISDFSFESKTENLINQLHDFSHRLDNILSSIQTKILAIPLSLILAFTQMKTDSSDHPLLINSGVLFAALIFSFLVLNLLKNQEVILNLIYNEFDTKRNRFKTKIPILYEEIKINFNLLQTQHQKTKCMLVFLRVITFIGIFTAIAFYIILTPNIYGLFLDTISYAKTININFLLTK